MLKRCIFTGMTVILAVIFLSCDDDCPTCPPPIDESVSDYNIILGANDNPFFIYNTKAKAIIDTVDMPPVTRYRGIAVNGDGSHLLISDADWDLGKLLVIDLESFDTVKVIDKAGWLSVSNTGKYIVFISGGRTYFLDGYTYDIIDSLDNNYGRGSFDGNDSKYCHISSGSDINIYDMASKSYDTSFTYTDNFGTSPILQQVQVDHGCSKFYMIALYNDFYLVAYSMAKDTTTLLYPIANMHDGDLRLTPDGRQIIYTDPGYLFYELPGTGHIIFIDVLTDAVLTILDGAFPAGNQVDISGFWPGKLAITPDSKYTIVSSAGLGGFAFGMIDNFSHRFVDVQPHTLPASTWNFVAACQKLPK